MAGKKRVGASALAEVGQLAPGWAHTHVQKRRWRSKGASIYPIDKRIFYEDLRQVLREYVLPGYTPSEPLLESNASVITLGSCFAAELGELLRQAGCSSDRVWIPTGLNNTYALLDFISWIVTGNETRSGFCYDTNTDGEIVEWKPEDERAELLVHLTGAGAFVFTLGLAEIWEDPGTGGVFWRGVPDDIFDAKRHVFRLSSVHENEGNILQIIELIRRVNETAPIVLTLSPVPLVGTFRGISCVTADCVSKSTLRVAIDGVVARHLEGVYYWPSFEIVRWLGGHLPWPTYGFDREQNSRHPTRYLVSVIVEAFVETFYTPAAVGELRARSGFLRVSEHPPRWLGESARFFATLTEKGERQPRSSLRRYARLALGARVR